MEQLYMVNLIYTLFGISRTSHQEDRVDTRFTVKRTGTTWPSYAEMHTFMRRQKNSEIRLLREFPDA
jgi:hypothetical protein